MKKLLIGSLIAAVVATVTLKAIVGLPHKPGILQVQHKAYASSAAAATHIITLDSTPVNNNLLVMTVVSSSTVSTPSGWSLASSAVNNVGAYIFYKVASSESGSITNTPGSSATMCIHVMEYSGLLAASPLDKTANNNAGAATTASSGTTAATTQANELAVAMFGWDTMSVTASSYSNGFTEDQETVATGTGTLVHIATAVQVLSAIGTQETTCTFSGTAGSPSCNIATFKGL